MGGGGDEEEVEGEEGEEDGDDKDDYWREQQEKLEIEKRAIVEDHSLVAEEKMRLLKEKEKKMEDLRREKDAAEMLGAKIKVLYPSAALSLSVPFLRSKILYSKTLA